jgi:hypothetical protein
VTDGANGGTYNCGTNDVTHLFSDVSPLKRFGELRARCGGEPMKPDFAMFNRRAGFSSALFALVLTLGCDRVHYRTHGFEWTSTESLPDLAIDIVATGTSQVQDSAGVLIERRASPYWMGIYFKRTAAVAVEVLEVTLTGQSTGVVITPRVGPPTGLGDGSLTLAAVAPGVELPFEDYRVQMRVRIGTGTEARDRHVAGTLKTRFEQSRAFRFWEKLMSV